MSNANNLRLMLSTTLIQLMFGCMCISIALGSNYFAYVTGYSYGNRILSLFLLCIGMAMGSLYQDCCKPKTDKLGFCSLLILTLAVVSFAIEICFSSSILFIFDLAHLLFGLSFSLALPILNKNNLCSIIKFSLQITAAFLFWDLFIIIIRQLNVSYDLINAISINAAFFIFITGNLLLCIYYFKLRQFYFTDEDRCALQKSSIQILAKAINLSVNSALTYLVITFFIMFFLCFYIDFCFYGIMTANGDLPLIIPILISMTIPIIACCLEKYGFDERLLLISWLITLISPLLVILGENSFSFWFINYLMVIPKIMALLYMTGLFFTIYPLFRRKCLVLVTPFICYSLSALSSSFLGQYVSGAAPVVFFTFLLCVSFSFFTQKIRFILAILTKPFNPDTAILDEIVNLMFHKKKLLPLLQNLNSCADRETQTETSKAPTQARPDVIKGAQATTDTVKEDLEPELLKHIENFCVEYDISRRERDVLYKIIKGLDTKQIASSLFVSENTVKSHIRKLLIKTNCSTRIHLIAKVYGNESETNTL